ncbi:hypothetical protein WICMUC_005961 [Wickerhamomyces mucosus]|uniref:DNA damage-inducible protein 1 n=1 Tax=Wickerhamomyces mucosus TaxID=1378264 RepID=A0A9P8P191_9ASCO|nr:hypothetical protein WICMUC_005961 [Wickerhamomyces mucosus]
MVTITASIEQNDDIFTIDISEDLTFDDFKAYLTAESGIEPKDQIIVLSGKEVNAEGSKTLKEIGFGDQEFIVVKKKSSSSPASSLGSGSLFEADQLGKQAEFFRQNILNNPAVRQQLTSTNPTLERYLDDPVTFKRYFLETLQHYQNQYDNNSSNAEELRRLETDPDNPDNQRRILEIINENNIEENMRHALDITPESFASVTMLYINVEVNGYPIKAFVDSGAQSTIINTALAERCNLTRLIDKRFRGVAQGVGQSEILGRVHSAPLKIENAFIPCSFTVLDTHVDMLLGLDMLKRHQANIDLKHNVLRIAEIETPFLPEAEIPKTSFNPSAFAPTVEEIESGVSFGKRQRSSESAVQAVFKRDSGSSNISDLSSASTNSSGSVHPSQSVFNFSDEKITNLMNLGFSREEVIKALKQANGNSEIAASILFH